MTGTTKRTYRTSTPGQVPMIDDQPAVLGMGSTDTMEIHGKTFPISEIVQAAFETSGLSLEMWNDAPAEERDAMFQSQVQELTELTAAAEKNLPLTATPRVQPVTATPRKHAFGAKPHPDDVDPDTITAPVETTHGWIVPSKPMQIPRG